MGEPMLILTDVAGNEARRVVDEGLAGHRVEQAGYWDVRSLYVLAGDPTNERTLGGIISRTPLGLMFVELMFLLVPRIKEARHTAMPVNQASWAEL